MGFARAADVPVVLIGDIDRGGVIASLVGTQAVLDPADAALIRGFLVNKFRGDPALFDDGMAARSPRAPAGPARPRPAFADAAPPAGRGRPRALARARRPRGRPLRIAVPDPAAHRQLRRPRSAARRARRRPRIVAPRRRRSPPTPISSSCPARRRPSPTSPPCAPPAGTSTSSPTTAAAAPSSASAAATRCSAAASPIRTGVEGPPGERRRASACSTSTPS